MFHRTECFIDHLTLCLPIPEWEQGQVDHVVVYGTPAELRPFRLQRAKKIPQYDEAYTLSVGNKRLCYLNVRPNFSHIGYMRVDFHPKTLGRLHCAVIFFFLLRCLLRPAEVLAEASISRVDMTIDVGGQHLRDVVFFGRSLGAFAHPPYLAGELVVGVRVGRGRMQCKVYDKKHDLLRHSEPRSQRIIIRTRTRLELQLREFGRVNNFNASDNKLAGWSVCRWSEVKRLLQPRDAVFARSVESLGLHGALQLESLARQRRLRKVFERHPVNWFDPDRIWPEGIAALRSVIDLGFGVFESDLFSEDLTA